MAFKKFRCYSAGSAGANEGPEYNKRWSGLLKMKCFFAGTYGTVFKAKNKESQEIVALKRVRLDDDDEVIKIQSV